MYKFWYLHLRAPIDAQLAYTGGPNEYIVMVFSWSHGQRSSAGPMDSSSSAGPMDSSSGGLMDYQGSLGLYGLSKEALNSVDFSGKFSSERRFGVLWSKFILKKLDN